MEVESLSSTTMATAGVATTASDAGGDAIGDEDNMTEGEKLAVSILLVTLSVFGTFGNGLVLYVFTRKSDKVTSTIFILSLAWCDFFTCLIIMPYTVANVQLEDNLVYDVICKLYHFLITCNVPLSAFIMVAVAVDRYFSICHPFLHAVTPRRARISILCLCLFAFSLGTITACMFGVYYIDYVPVGNCSAETDYNATKFDVIAISKGDVHSKDGASVSSQDTGNFTTFYSKVEVIIDDTPYGRKHHNQPQLNNNNTTPNVITSPNPSCSPEKEKKYVYHKGGLCTINEIIFSTTFFEWYHKIYISFYIISLLSVFTLYFLIYRSVVKRRAWRRKQKSWAHSPMTAVTNNAHNMTAKTNLASEQQNADGEDMELNPKMGGRSNGENIGTGSGSDGGGVSDKLTDEGATDSGISGCKHTDSNPSAAGTGSGQKESGCENGKETAVSVSRQLSSSAEKKSSRERRDFNFLANIRTAVMLFVVTIVFIISFLPAWLMATFLIDYHVFVFYMYFIYNVANPVIYAFMNQSFRKELKRVFQRGTHFFRSG